MTTTRPIFLFTDFGWSGPYVGQMIAAIHAATPQASVINLMHDAPRMQPRLAAYLLPACCRTLADQSLVVAVVDPGVGGQRKALIVETARATYIGPDNGLLSQVGAIRHVRTIDWTPQYLSSSFHGRDLFAPVAAQIAVGRSVGSSMMDSAAMQGADWPEQTNQVIYCDDFGNLMTGLRAEKINKNNIIVASGQRIAYAETFSSVAHGALFWYPNSQGLVEIAANGDSAAALLSLALGAEILVN